MNTTPKDGGPAFPHGPLGDTIRGEDGREWSQFPAGCGMSLRDWFAGQALIGVLADPNYDSPVEKAANYCYRVADAMLAEREKGL